ncbi:MAG TPA: hypothetical protein VKQ30_23260 [Ktedonobacterales bacterium]|nr:hypothetical protein [Ktedonobacterales bacterium]
MNATQARQAWLIAKDEYDAIHNAIWLIHCNRLGAQAPLLSPLLPEAQRRLDEAYGTMVRLRDEEDEARWQELKERMKSFVPPDDNPIWTMDLCAAPVKPRGRPPKARVSP